MRVRMNIRTSAESRETDNYKARKSGHARTAVRRRV
jgi:hypothetical protein